MNNLFLSNIGSLLHLLLQRLDFTGKRISRWADLLNTRWLRLSEKVADGAIAHAQLRQADRVFCGHTHIPLRCESEGVEYYNSGSWTDARPTYITVGSEGVRIQEYQERPGPRNAGEEAAHADALMIDLSDESQVLEEAEYEGISS